MQLKDQPGHAWQDSRRTGAHEKLKVGNRNREAATACVVVEPSCKRVVSHTTGTAARQGAEAPDIDAPKDGRCEEEAMYPEGCTYL